MNNIILTSIPLDELLEKLADRVLQKTPLQTSISSKPVNIVSEEQLAKKLNVTRQTVAAWRKRGRIPYMAIGAAIRYDLYKVLETLEKLEEKQG